MTLPSPDRVPREPINDYTEAEAALRRAFACEHTGVELCDVGVYSVDPHSVAGNIENFTGVAQVPLGIAGPLRINGEHAQGDFYIPLATTEGTLVASYGRGMRLLTACGGVKTCVVEQFMQRAPVFLLADAVQARELGAWVRAHFEDLKRAAEATTHVGKLDHIEQYQIGPARFLRFNFTTGDAAGQNMCGKATAAACEWIRAHWPGSLEYLLSGNIDTDKKHSVMNTLHTRGRRVVAEVVLPAGLLREMMGVSPRDYFRWRQLQTAGAFMVGSASNGAQVANAVAALFIATGQDVADVAESQAAITYTQLRDDGDYYWSLTLPSLIVATCGGGTGLATQRQCLEMLGCHGAGKANKLAEICAAVALAGDISLASAVIHGDWVSSHERLGRNRPPGT
ncbi:MAG TPA: hydroxymethylglutaryl-CoA reductase [Kofleriaceae bacterium]|nr:hydroxymethylglutaryl-CoA reductase [Kofleriaceae bacterium]